MACRALTLTVLGWLSHTASASEAGDSPARFWGGLGLGYGYLSASPGPAPSGAGGVWLEVQLGMHVAPHWLAGFELGGLGLQISERNYDPQNGYSSIYGQGTTHELLVVQYQPGSEAGWFTGAGVGGLLYDNRALERVTLNERSGNGIAGLVRAGYGWRMSRRLHLELDVNYERGNVRLNAPLPGRFDVGMVALDFRVAYH